MKILNNAETIAIAKMLLKQISSHEEYEPVSINQVYENEHSKALIEDPRSNHLLGRIRNIEISSESQHKQDLEDQQEVLKYLVNHGYAKPIKDSNRIKLTEKGRLLKKGTIILKSIFGKIYPINFRLMATVITSICGGVIAIIGILPEQQKNDLYKSFISLFKNSIFYP